MDFLSNLTEKREDKIVNPTYSINYGEDSKVSFHLCCQVDGLAHIIHGLYAKWCFLILIQEKQQESWVKKSPEGVVISGSWRSERMLIAKAHRSVKINFTCSLLIRWDTMWRVKARHDSKEHDRISLGLSLCVRHWAVHAPSCGMGESSQAFLNTLRSTWKWLSNWDVGLEAVNLMTGCHVMMWISAEDVANYGPVLKAWKTGLEGPVRPMRSLRDSPLFSIFFLLNIIIWTVLYIPGTINLLCICHSLTSEGVLIVYDQTLPGLRW